MKTSFVNMYSAISGTGYRRYIEDFYDVPAEQPIVNMQVRYWIEAVEKFNNLPEHEYNARTIEEGILIINLLANSLLTLGGANWQGNGHVPSLPALYDNDPFPLRSKRPELYSSLKELNKLYNKLSKHFCLARSDLYHELTYAQLQKLYRATADIWLFVCNEHQSTHDFDRLFIEPHAFVKRPYYPETTDGYAE